jgi:hypothetical protein
VGLVDVALGALQTNMYDLAVVGEVNEFGLGGLGFVVNLVDKRLMG